MGMWLYNRIQLLSLEVMAIPFYYIKHVSCSQWDVAKGHLLSQVFRILANTLLHALYYKHVWVVMVTMDTWIQQLNVDVPILHSYLNF